MALIDCFECNNKASNTAKLCPHCGFNIKKEINLKYIKIITIFLARIFLTNQ